VTQRLVHLVDDDDAMRRSLARLLELSGYAVKSYASGTELLDAAHELGGGCVLIDLNMPGLDGIAVCKALNDRSIDVPVILMTGSCDLATLSSEANVAGVIQKPFLRAELMSLLDELAIASQTDAKSS